MICYENIVDVVALLKNILSCFSKKKYLIIVDKLMFSTWNDNYRNKTTELYSWKHNFFLDKFLET